MKKIILISSGLLTLILTPASHAANLVEAFQAALKSDPVYKEAEAQYETSKTLIAQARAGVLPNISLQANLDRSNQETNYNSPLVGGYPGYAGTNSNVDLLQRGYTLSITQPIFNWQAFKQIQQAQASVQQAAATYSAAGQDLIIRLATAYFNVLEAQDIVRYSKSQEAALSRQYEVARQRYHVGLDPIASLYKSQAAYDAARADTLAEENNLANQREALRTITGNYYPNLTTLTDDFPLVSPEPLQIGQWVKTSLQQNLTLRAARLGVLAAQQNIKVQAAGNMPTLSATGSLENQNSKSVPDNQNGVQNQRTGTVGLALAFPIYNGGLTNANTAQAEGQYQLAIAQMEQQYRSTVSYARTSFLNIKSQISQVEADRQSIKSHQAALSSIEAGYKAGTQTILDVLQAQSDLFEAEKNYTTDRFAYLLNTLKLKEAAGILTPNDLININRWLSNQQTTTLNAASQQLMDSVDKANAKPTVAKKPTAPVPPKNGTKVTPKTATAPTKAAAPTKATAKKTTTTTNNTKTGTQN